jgi:hypothetical protein
MNNPNYKKIVDLIYSSIISEGGDGDAIWLYRHIHQDEVIRLLTEFNSEYKTGWDITIYVNHIVWGLGDEWAIITNDENFFNSEPNWIILKIRY